MLAYVSRRDQAGDDEAQQAMPMPGAASGAAMQPCSIQVTDVAVVGASSNPACSPAGAAGRCGKNYDLPSPLDEDLEDGCGARWGQMGDFWGQEGALKSLVAMRAVALGNWLCPEVPTVWCLTVIVCTSHAFIPSLM